MRRADGRWIPDGRAKAIRADCEASLDALDGLEIDLYLIHAPDPRTPWRTSLRALARLVDEGLVRRVGVANVNRGQLDDALELVPLAAVQVALSVFDDSALRGGVVDRCEEKGIACMAHSPLGGPRRAGRLDRTEAEMAIAWVLALGENVIAIPGARRPETARSAARAASLRLTRAELDRIGRPTERRPRAKQRGGDVVLVMGIPGAGKSRVAEEYVARGYVRLNRDERGGSLRGIATALDEQLTSGARRFVLDNTYLTRASRNHVVEVAAAHGVATRCIWLDTPLAQAQVNLVERLIERFGSLPAPDELKKLARTEPGVMAPTSQMRAFRELEPPAADEGFAAVETIRFSRASRARHARGVFVAAAALDRPAWETHVDPSAPRLVFDWRPGKPAGENERIAVCPHPGGPPTCWCRPPLPGLLLAFAHKHNIDPARSTLVGTSPAHRTLASALGACYLAA
jgi:predicted kinase